MAGILPFFQYLRDGRWDAAATNHGEITRMCGILGGVFRRPVTEAETAAFRRAIHTLEHRGPDAEAVTLVPAANAVLCFRRLAIIDLTTGDQPMATEGGRQHIVFNGEIYNYQEVRKRLEADGVRFRTRSDTEVLLRSLARDGVAALAPLRGMWGFGLLDLARHELLLARDRLGVKQLYYADRPEGIFFASEPKALLALPWIHAEFAKEQLPDYFTFRAVPAPGTLIRGIAKLAAGTLLRYNLDTGASRIERYWSAPDPLKSRLDPIPAGEAVDRLEAALLEAVRRRLVADVPVGAFLSGGLDSSLVVAAMRRLGHADIQTFSATFPGSADDEGTFARRVADRFGTRHHEQPSAVDEFLGALPRWSALNDDLVADASSLPLLSVSRLARESGLKVMLSGEGSDELFGGYGSYHKFLLLRRFATLLPSQGLRAGLLAALRSARLVGEQDLPRVVEYFVRRGGYMGTAAVLGEPELDELVGNGRMHRPPRAEGRDLAALGAFDFVRRIPDDLLVRTDRATMGASIEARVPFLDHDLVELASRLPHRIRAVPGVSKVALRLIARRWGVPYQTIVHRKIGFQIPLGRWFRGPLRSLWERIVRERLVPGLNYDAVSRLYQSHTRGSGSFEESLWRIAALELWYRRWIGGMPLEEFAPAPMGLLASTPP